MIKTKTKNEPLTMEVPQRPLGCIIKVTSFFFVSTLKNNQEHRVDKLDKLWHFNFNHILLDKRFLVNEIIN